MLQGFRADCLGHLREALLVSDVVVLHVKVLNDVADDVGVFRVVAGTDGHDVVEVAQDTHLHEIAFLRTEQDDLAVVNDLDGNHAVLVDGEAVWHGDGVQFLLGQNRPDLELVLLVAHSRASVAGCKV